MVKLRDVMSRDPVTFSAETDLVDAIEVLAERHIGGAPVVKGDRIVGVLTSGDILEFVSANPAVLADYGDTDTDKPTLTIYMPNNTAQPMSAVVIAPGGGYVNLAMNHEGRQIASYFNSLGMAAFVLKYRLGPRYRHPIELGDIQRAMRTVRGRAAEWRIRPDHIGVMGFSAVGVIMIMVGLVGLIGLNKLKTELPVLEQQYLKELMQTSDAVEGLNAFLEKRPAVWRHA